MQITYSLNERDVYEADKAYCEGTRSRVKRRIGSWILYLFFFGLGLFFIWRDENSRTLGFVFVAIGALLFLINSGFLLRIFATRYFKKNPNLAKEARFEFSDEGMECWAEDVHTKSGWSIFQRWQESKNLFLVYTNTRIYNIIPKRAFAPGEVDDFRALLWRKIPKK